MENMKNIEHPDLPLSDLIRQLSSCFKRGYISSEEKRNVKSLLLSGNDNRVSAARSLITTIEHVRSFPRAAFSPQTMQRSNPLLSSSSSPPDHKPGTPTLASEGSGNENVSRPTSLYESKKATSSPSPSPPPPPSPSPTSSSSSSTSSTSLSPTVSSPSPTPSSLPSPSSTSSTPITPFSSSSTSSPPPSRSPSHRRSKVLYIMRGVSGSGKSTLANKILAEYHRKDGKEAQDSKDTGVVYGADDWFVMNGKGTYLFDAGKLQTAHRWNQQRAREAMKTGTSPLLIDNTMTQKWEAKPYVQAGLEYGYEIIFRETDTPWRKNAEELARRNTHGVSREVIRKMLDRWESDFTIENVLNCQLPRWMRKRSNGNSRPKGHRHLPQKHQSRRGSRR